MKLYMYYYGARPDLAEKFNGRVIKNKTILPLNLNAFNEVNLKGYPKGSLKFHAWEKGSVFDVSSDISLVGGYTGERLRPLYTKTQLNGKHALFVRSITKGISYVQYSSINDLGRLKITRVRNFLKIKDDIYRLNVTSNNFVFNGKEEEKIFLEDIPLELTSFQNIIDSAIKKSTLKKCDSPIYVL